MKHKLLMSALFCALIYNSPMNQSRAAPVGTSHGKNLNVGQIEFLDQSKANKGQKIIGSVTTPMVYNGLYTQDIGAIVLGDEYLYGSDDSVFQNENQTLGLMDINGYEIAAREYIKATRNIRLFCSTDPVYRSKKVTTCYEHGQNGSETCRTKTVKGATCNEHTKAFQDYLSKDYLAPDVETYQVCVANCNTSSGSGGSSGGGGCFVAGTKITLANGAIKNIEEIQVGDTVLVYDFKNNNFVPSVVTKLFQFQRESTLIINGHVETTDDHPFLLEDNTWAVYDLTNGQKLHPEIRSIFNISSSLRMIDKNVNVHSIEKKNESKTVYTFAVEHHDHNYIANGFIVHNKIESGGNK